VSLTRCPLLTLVPFAESSELVPRSVWARDVPQPRLETIAVLILAEQLGKAHEQVVY